MVSFGPLTAEIGSGVWGTPTSFNGFYVLACVTARHLFLASSVCGFLFVHEIFREPLNGFAPNSHERRAWSLAGTSLKVKVKGQGHQGQKTAFSALLAACMRFMFGKTSLAFSFFNFLGKHAFGGLMCVTRNSEHPRQLVLDPS